jgi:hypothetical protein
VCWIVCRKSTNDTDCQLPVVEHLIIQCDEQTANIFRLGEMSIEFGVQLFKDRLTDSRS